MAISLQHHHRTIFVPPVELPMSVRLPNGQFGVDRHEKEEETITWKVPTFSKYKSFTYRRLRAHYGLDLRGKAGSPVFAAKRGTIVEFLDEDAHDQRVTIRHIEQGGQGFVTRYVHLQRVNKDVGERVAQGECIGFIGDNHLHFEIHLILNEHASKDWNRINSVPIDPLPYLYRWEEIYFDLIKPDPNSPDYDPDYSRAWFGSYGDLKQLSIVQRNGLPWCEVQHSEDGTCRAPLVDSGERNTRLIELLERAFFSGCKTRLMLRRSPFFEDQKIILEAQVRPG